MSIRRKLMYYPMFCQIDTLRVYDLPLSNMTRKPDERQPLPPLEPLPGPPTEPGWYWWSDERASRGIMVQIRLIDGQLKMQRFYQGDVPVADAKGYWRGPLRPSTGPGEKSGDEKVWSDFMVVEAYRSKEEEAVLSFTTAC